LWSKLAADGKRAVSSREETKCLRNAFSRMIAAGISEARTAEAMAALTVAYELIRRNQKYIGNVKLRPQRSGCTFFTHARA
jgi:hypothetical protein